MRICTTIRSRGRGLLIVVACIALFVGPAGVLLRPGAVGAQAEPRTGAEAGGEGGSGLSVRFQSLGDASMAKLGKMLNRKARALVIVRHDLRKVFARAFVDRDVR